MNRNKKSISFGDRIFARVTRNGQTIFNYVSEKVANMTQLISEIRFANKDVKGLVMVHIRNYNQGWGEERPLMLYAEKVRTSGYNTETYNSPYRDSESTRMLFPWETH